ncbi:fasciclin [Sphingomonas deserti]|uniref:Fasciclin n=2 Tax=Allosphingosinicella deserti TaxID=2116704 RepID=A0A2P7QIJ0_9SPHN|nr:fasciclin [Sphingomonas deserti]
MNDDRMAAATASTAADATVMVGGAEMYPTRNIIENAVNSADHTTLVAAVKAAGLVETLSGAGPFTVFAPTNAAFAKLPAGTVETLLRPENKAMLQSVLIYHVVPGRTSAVDLMAAIRAGGGSAMLTTVQGGTLTARMRGSDVILVDGKGNSATVSQADVMQSNGVIHVTDAVSVPG